MLLNSAQQCSNIISYKQRIMQIRNQSFLVNKIEPIIFFFSIDFNIEQKIKLDFNYKHINKSSMLIYTAVITLLFTCLLGDISKDESFPKILWIYWQQGFESAPSFTQLSIINKQRYAALSGWQVRFLNESTVQKYINVSLIDQMMENAEDKLVQLRADILRMMLLYQYGGMWMDANSFFLRPLDWIDQIKNDTHIYNKLSSHPQILIGAYTKYSRSKTGNITYHFDIKYNQMVNVFPGLQDWFMIAQPKSLFLRDALEKLKVILKTKKKNMDEQILSEGIILSKEHLDPYLIGSDYLFQILLQSKQKELQANHSTVKYAVEHYRIWHFEADQNVYRFTVYTRFKRYQMWADLITYSLEDLHDVFAVNPYFLKFIGWQHPQFSLYLSNYASFNCWGGDQIIQNHSIIHNYLIYELQSNATRAILSIKGLQKSNNDNIFCRSKINSEFQVSNHQKLINFCAETCFIVSLIIMMLLVKKAYNLCQSQIKFEQIPYSYR